MLQILLLSLALSPPTDTLQKDTVYHGLIVRQRGIEINQVCDDASDIYYALRAIEYYLDKMKEEQPE